MELSDLIRLIATVAAGLFGIPLIDLLKKRLKLEDEEALLLTGVVCILLGLLVAFLGMLATGITPTWPAVAESIGTICGVAMFVYGMTKERKAPIAS